MLRASSRTLAITFCVVLLIAVVASCADAQAAPRSHHYRSIVCKVFGPNCAAAWRVVSCESHGSRWAWSGADAGLFQANYPAHHAPGESVASFRARHARVWWHVRWAYRLSHGGRDWSAWTCQP